MNQDLSLLERTHHGLCKAIEKGGAICFGKKKGRGLCAKHYERLRTTGSVILPIKKDKSCMFIACNNKLYAKKCCIKHYMKYVYAPINKRKECSVDGCIKRRTSLKKYCGSHSKMMDRYGTINKDDLDKKSKNRKSLFKIGHEINRKSYNNKCIAPGCDITCRKQRIIKGLCIKHYARWLRHGDYNKLVYRKPENVCHTKQMD
jgi:hypothetical protein